MVGRDPGVTSLMVIIRKNLRGNDSRIRIVFMTADQGTFTDIFADLTELFFPLKANTRYGFCVVYRFDADTGTPDASFTFTVPAGASAFGFFLSDDLGANIAWGTGTIKQGTGAVARLLGLYGVVATGATQGNLQAQFAQDLLTPADEMRVLAGSYFMIYELGGV